MEGDAIYRHSYNQMVGLLKQNATDNISIDYTKLDCQTKEELKKAIDLVLNKRKREIGTIVFVAK